jgi:hypothetical protein
MYENKGTKNILPYLNNDLTQYEKDECKILISEYLNDSSKNKRLNAKNANQLYYIIDFLIEYINNKEKLYKEKVNKSIN